MLGTYGPAMQLADLIEALRRKQSASERTPAGKVVGELTGDGKTVAVVAAWGRYVSLPEQIRRDAAAVPSLDQRAVDETLTHPTLALEAAGLRRPVADIPADHLSGPVAGGLRVLGAAIAQNLRGARALDEGAAGDLVTEAMELRESVDDNSEIPMDMKCYLLAALDDVIQSLKLVSVFGAEGVRQALVDALAVRIPPGDAEVPEEVKGFFARLWQATTNVATAGTLAQWAIAVSTTLPPG